MFRVHFEVTSFSSISYCSNSQGRSKGRARGAVAPGAIFRGAQKPGKTSQFSHFTAVYFNPILSGPSCFQTLSKYLTRLVNK